MSSWPERKPTASARLPIGMTLSPSTTAASAALAAGTSRPSRFSAAACKAMASTPLIGRVSPVRASSPTMANEPGRSKATCPLPSSSPSAIGRSKPPASFFRSAGARLITTRSIGRRYPELTIARSTRCVLSLTAVSARPTRTVLGFEENETSTSTSTGVASMPTSVYEASFASIRGFRAGSDFDRGRCDIGPPETVRADGEDSTMS